MAKEKLKKSGCETMSIIDEIKKNPEAKGVKIIK
jgi:ribosomal protein L18E